MDALERARATEAHDYTCQSGSTIVGTATARTERWNECSRPVSETREGDRGGRRSTLSSDEAEKFESSGTQQRNIAYVGPLVPSVQQREASQAGLGANAISAGPGSGKTRTIVFRAKYLISQGMVQ